ncbi:hypothetical protein BJY04DRAFT_218843 [Aspergillus karnatakaensis]|uniref:uncharacterized protein n=1 Tax=Aspergillus karnatakaensis TaxID=1810916 RepID=UPI003CCD0A73
MNLTKDLRSYTHLLFSTISPSYLRKTMLKEAQKKRLKKKLGYDRPDKGPDTSLVAIEFELVSMGKKRTIRDWTRDLECSERIIGITKAIHKIWHAEYTNSKIKSLDVFIKSRLGVLLVEIQRPLDYTNLLGIRSIHITGKRRLHMPFMTQGRRARLTGKVDHAIFAGDPEDLDVTLLVVRARKEGRVCVWTMLKLMAPIHHARKKAGKDSEIYGLITDASYYAFVHIDKKSRYSFWLLDWHRDAYEIVAQVEKIYKYSIVRATAAAKAGSGGKSTSEVTGCRIYPPEEVIYSALQEN